MGGHQEIMRLYADTRSIACRRGLFVVLFDIAAASCTTIGLKSPNIPETGRLLRMLVRHDIPEKFATACRYTPPGLADALASDLTKQFDGDAGNETLRALYCGRSSG